MGSGPVFDILLFGFRNDLARAQALVYLDQLPPDQSGPARLEHGALQPQRLFVALDADRARELCRELERRGAQVACVAVEAASRPVEAPVLAAPAAAGGRLRRWWPLLAVGAAAAVALLRAAPPGRSRPAMGLDLRPAVFGTLLRPRAGADSRAVVLNSRGIREATAQQFADAVDSLHAALRLVPDDPVLTRNLQVVLYNWGVADLVAARYADAGAHLEQAVQLGQRPEILTALGVSYLRRDDYPRADGALQQALTLSAKDPNALLALMQVALAQDQRPRALDLLERAKEAGAQGPELDKLQQQLSREVDAEWGFVARDSPHFRASFAGDDDPRAVRQILAALEDAYDTVGRKFSYYPDEKTEVVLYTQQDFHSITQTPDWAGAAFDGRIKVPVRGLNTDEPALLGILRHEYAHSLVARLAGSSCPVWLNEGLAVWAEEDEDGQRAPWARSRLADQPLFTLEALNGSFAGIPRNRVEAAYAESYLAARALFDRCGPATIPKLLRALGSSHSLGTAFTTVCGDDLAAFEEEFLRQVSG